MRDVWHLNQASAEGGRDIIVGSVCISGLQPTLSRLMDNASRSERTRRAIIEATLNIIVRDGPGKLTLDAIAREGGMSKGALMHQFPTKQAVLKALAEHQIANSTKFLEQRRTEHASHPQPELAAEIAALREALARPRSLAFAILGAVAQEPNLLAMAREAAAERLEILKAEASDPDLATVRWAAAWGLVLPALLGLSPLKAKERDRLFERLLDDTQWSALPSTGRPSAGDAVTSKRKKR